MKLRSWLIAAGFLGILAAGVVFAVTTLVSANADRPESKVLALYRALETVDCEAFAATAMPEVLDEHFSATGSFSCAEWERVAQAFTVDGEFVLSIDIISAPEGAGLHDAEVVTRETNVLDGIERSVTYTLAREAGPWMIVGYESRVVE